MAAVGVSVSGALPGEAALVALLEFAGKVRGSMDAALVARLDAVLVQQVEDLQSVWRGLWVQAGVVK